MSSAASHTSSESSLTLQLWATGADPNGATNIIPEISYLKAVSGGFNRSSSSGNATIHGQDGEEELAKIGNAIVRFDAESQATDSDWNL